MEKGKKREGTIRERFQYWFDNKMTKGSFALQYGMDFVGIYRRKEPECF